jgi:endonuclease/exonuclease/phosphatase family metal-dependent hydrolase
MVGSLPLPGAPQTFRVATYNLENYLGQPAGTRPAKSAEGKAKIRESLRALNADVVALQEMGSTNELLELRSSLKADGTYYQYWEHVSGWDTNIHVAVLSRFPITASRPHTNDSFLLFGRRFRVNRGFAEVDIRVNDQYSFTLLTTHLKSRRPVPEADEAELREQEAILLREKIDALCQANPKVNLIDPCRNRPRQIRAGRHPSRRAQWRRSAESQSALRAAQHHLDPLLRERGQL